MFFSSYRRLMAAFGVFGCFCLFKRYFYSARGYGKSPCFSQDAFLQSISPDCLLPMLPFADGAENME